MAGILGLFILFGIGLIVTPIAVLIMGHNLGTVTNILMMGFGVILTVASMVVITITKLYRKTKASEAFVRTGMGGPKVIVNGGAIVFPMIHDLVKVSLETFRLEVERKETDALITEDKLRVDIKAEFFVKVQPDEEGIKTAARSLGDKLNQRDGVKQLIEDKLVSALRTVAAQKTLEQLNSDRATFMTEVTRLVTTDLDHNGLKLETATISKLDQTSAQFLKTDNVFDVQGLRSIAKVTQEQLTEKNKLEREGEQARKKQDVETRQRVLAFEQTQAQAEAEQQSKIAAIQAEQERSAKEKQIAASRAVELASVEKAQSLEVAARKKEEVIEVARRAQQEAIAKAEESRARAEAEQAKAETERETAKQAVTTVTVVAEAERQKQKQVLEAQATAEKTFVAEQRKADADAYRIEKEANAKKTAADAEAEAITKKANAEATASTKRAEGKLAEDKVPVLVNQAQVEVEKKRVEVAQASADVEIKLLEKREQFGKAGIELQVRLAEIAANRDAAIEGAKAQGLALASANLTLWGSNEMLDKLTASFTGGQGVAQAMNGFFNSAGPEGKAAFGVLTGLVGAIAKKLGLPEEEVAAAIEQVQKSAPPPALPKPVGKIDPSKKA